jgi:hypothetical protein
LPVRGATAAGLLRFVLFEELPRFFKGERVSVDDQLVFARVFRDGDDGVNTMAMLPEGLNDEIDVYHASKSTAAGFRRDTPLTAHDFEYAEICRMPACLNRCIMQPFGCMSNLEPGEENWGNEVVGTQ